MSDLKRFTLELDEADLEKLRAVATYDSRTLAGELRALVRQRYDAVMPSSQP